jgi:hypothetical protein
MLEQSILINLTSPGIAKNTTSQLRQEYQTCQNLFQAQPTLVQQYLGAQAASLAEAIVQGSHQVQFSLPDRVVLQPQEKDTHVMLVPNEVRKQQIGGFINHQIRSDLCTALRLRIMDLEHSKNKAISISGILMRYALVIHMVHEMLPSGKSVQYKAPEGEEIPSIPVQNENVPGSGIIAMTDSISVENSRGEMGRGELVVPYVEAARRYFLPQWVAFDDEGHLLVGSVNDAEAEIASMQRYLSVLHAAVGMAPYMVADEEYQRKRYGILGQLVNQGRALASYELEEIIRTIKCRAASHDLDRGLNLSLPYFNDQTLALEIYDFNVIPAGRVMFVPAFVVLAVRAQGAKVAQDTYLNKSTRRHLLMELSTLEETFLR